MTYDRLEELSAVLRSTTKAWRSKSAPGLTAIEACLVALNHKLVAVPSIDSMPPDLRANLEPLAQKHGVSIEHLVAWLVEVRALGEVLTADAQARLLAARSRG